MSVVPKNLGESIEDAAPLAWRLDGENWVKNLEQYHQEAAELTNLSSHKRRSPQRGIRAQTIISYIL